MMRDRLLSRFEKDGYVQAVDNNRWRQYAQLEFPENPDDGLIYQDGIPRFNVDVPNTLEGDWKSALEIVTDDLYDPETGIDLLVRAPGYYKINELRKGKYRDSGLEFIAGGEQASAKLDKPAHAGYEPLWTADFNDGSFSLNTGNGKNIKPELTNNCTIVDSRKGKAVKISDKGALTYKLPEPQPISQGMIEFWLKPEYSEGDKKTRVFAHLISANAHIRFIKNQSYSYMFIIYAEGRANIVSVKPVMIKTASWNYISLQWDEAKKSMTLNINGVETAKTNFAFSFEHHFQSLIIGDIRKDGDQCCNSTIDEFKVLKIKTTQK
jgi:hypothetical protein